MTDGENTEPTQDEPTAQDEKKDGGRNDIVDAVIGLAVLGLGAAVVSGSMSLGGVLRGLTRTPPVGPM